MSIICRSCGTENDDTAIFCSNCGLKFENDDARLEVKKDLTQTLETVEKIKTEQNNTLSGEVLDNRDKVLNYYIETAKKRGRLTPDQLIDQYKAIKLKLDVILSHQNALEDYNKRIEDVYEMEKKISKGETPGWVYGGAFICFVIGFIRGDGFFGKILCAFLAGGMAYGFLDYCIYKCCIFPFIKDKLKKKAEEYREKNLAEIQQMIDKTKAYLDECWASKEMELYEIAIPPQYQSYEAIECFISFLTSRRADTEKELFNMYEEEKHRREMEAMQQQQLQYSKDIIYNQQEHTKLMNKQTSLINESNALARENNALSRQSNNLAMQNNAFAKQQLNMSQRQLNIERKILRNVKK